MKRKKERINEMEFVITPKLCVLNYFWFDTRSDQWTAAAAAKRQI